MILKLHPPNWSIISDVKDNPRMKIPVFGNGDINSPEAALEIKNKFGLDGAMIGRASIGNPWIFNQIKHYLKFGEKSLDYFIGTVSYTHLTLPTKRIV